MKPLDSAFTEKLTIAKRTWTTVLGSLLLCAPLFSQGGQGSIQGSVFDQSGGSIAGATVTVVDVARGVTRTLTTDSAGAYIATNMTPGTYTVKGEASGFQTLQHANVQVEVGQNVRVDLTLQAGTQAQTVTVTSEVPAIDTTDATLGGTVSNAAILALPLNGRNFERLLQLRPGVITTVGAGTGSSSTNGRRAGNDVLVVEGIPQFSGSGSTNGVLNMVYRGGDSDSLLPIDAIQEFNNQQNPKAEYGWRDGSIITVGVKSGTNDLHGTAYAFGRDSSATDAANPFTQTITPANLEQFGGTAGGRIVKDKLFWFAGYEGLRDTLGDVAVDTIPSDIAGPGTSVSMVDACDSIASNNKGASTPPYNAIGIKGPNGAVNALTAQLSGITIDPQLGCKVSPSSSTVENLFPYNVSASPNFSPNLVNTGPLNNGVIKGDYVPGPRQHISGMFYESRTSQINNYASGELLPQWEGDVNSDVKMFEGAWIWTPNSTWVNEFRTGASYFTADTFPADLNISTAAPWPTGYGIKTGVTNPLYGGFPEIQISSFTGYLGAGNHSSTRGPEGDFSLVDSVSYLHGKHAFKFGFDYVDVIFDGNSFNTAQGDIKFTTLVNFLSGTPKNGSIVVGNADFNGRAHWYAGFFQDDWRVASRVTLNMGLRYEFLGSPWERNNYLGNFDPNVDPSTTPAVQQIGPGEPIRSLLKAYYLGFAPRLGTAWDVRGNGRTVVRAGASVLRNTTPLGPFFATVPFGANFPSIGVNTVGTNVNAHTPETFALTAATINWNTAGPIFPVSSATGVTCSPASPCKMPSIDPNFHEPYAAEWNLDVQRAITNSLTIAVAYIGNHGFDEPYQHDLDEPPLGAGWAGAASTNCLNSAPLYSNCKVNTAAEVGQYSTEFPYFNYITELSNGAFSNYNGLQVTVNERASHGLSFLAGYTLSHALDVYSMTGGGIPISVLPNDIRQDYATSSNDIRNRFTLAPTYLVPGLKSPGQMLQGWSLSAIVTLQGGMPWYPEDVTTDLQGNGEFNNGAIENWDYSGPPSAFTSGPHSIPCYTAGGSSPVLPGCTPYPVVGGVPQPPAACMTAAQANGQLAVASLMNLGCYLQGGGVLTPAAYGTIGSASRNIFRGPAYYNVDLSIGKLWKFRERYSAEFRAEFFNLFNRADFPTPAVLDPNSGLTGQFGCSCSTPDSGNPVLGSGGPRHIQFGLKLIF